MIPRYSTSQMNDIWSNKNKLTLWFDVELASIFGWERVGKIPEGTFQSVEAASKLIDFNRLFERALQIEEDTRHDVIAFLSAVEEQIGDQSRYVHFGLTSSDVVDTAFALQLAQAGRQIRVRLKSFKDELLKKAIEFKEVVCLGRTHGQAAEVTTFGAKLLGFVAEIERGILRIESSIKTISVGKMSGAVGNYANSHPEMEKLALEKLGLQVEKVATQVVCRDRHADFFSTLAIIAGSLERWAVELRLLAHVQIAEAFEPFGKKQRGSSAMPHKRNPVLSENVTGLCRLVRGYASMAFENQALWHERDISHSSVERIIGPDATQALDFALKRMTEVVSNIEIDEASMKQHVDETKGAVFSGAILLALVEKGVLRQEAYGWVQSAAKRQKTEGIPLESALAEDVKISSLLNKDEIASLCDMRTNLKYVDTLFSRFTA